MKRYLICSIIAMFFCINGISANTINKIDMDIFIDKNGDAYVNETWDYTSSQNTEIFHAYPNLGDSTITELKVTDSTGRIYDYDSDWDITGSFSDKQYKFGYHYVDNGVELCWGISHYGTYKYTVSYKINGFIYDVEDAQIAYWTLLQKNNENLQNYYIKIYADDKFSDDLPLWGYGKKGAYAYVYDGYIELSSDSPLNEEEYVAMLIKFPKETFNTKYNLDYPFDNMLEMANEGSTPFKEKTNWLDLIINLIEFLAIPFLFITAVFSRAVSHNGKLHKKTIPKKDVPAFRDFPCGNDMFKAFFVATEYKQVLNKTDFLGTILLKWLKEDIISITTEEKGILKSKSTKITMPKEVVEVPFTNKLETKLYGMMRTASNDGILEQNEFNRYCKNNYRKVLDWFDDCIDDEYYKIIMTDLVMKDEKRKNKYNASPKLDEIALHMAGLKRFYKEFGSIYDKKAIEVKLWREHLMYAQIFGVAKEVAKEFKALYPTEIMEAEIDNIILVNSFSTSSMSSASTAKSRAESYSAGGGGFSSGGGGGGSFGGGGSMGSR